MRRVTGLILLASLLAGLSGDALAAKRKGQGAAKPRRGAGKKRAPSKVSKPRRSANFSDEAVQRSIEKGCRYLWSQRQKDGSWPKYKHKNYPVGPTALAAYALLASGVSPFDRRMEKTLEWLSKQDTDKTYTLGLRCNAWYLANKRTNDKYARFFRQDLRKLIMHTYGGAYKYDCKRNAGGRTDNSNSQYGVLGTWAGAMARQEIPLQYWRLVLEHWKRDQKADGGWGYRSNENPSATMVVGGIATLYVCFDNLFADRFVGCNINTDYRPIVLGLKWIDRHFRESLNGKHMGHGDLYYFLYGVERVGLASGYKYFGTSDWYKLGAVKAMGQQAGDGSWNAKRGRLVATCFALLFLVRGQHPIALNKLEFDGDWNNRPRDAAGLTRWLSNAFEKTLNWQIINLNVPVEEWHDAPVLYLSGAKEPKFTDQHLRKLRKYVWQGGTIFSVTECRGQGFRKGIRSVYRKLFPNYPLEPAAAGHDLYTIHKRLEGWPDFHLVHNGIRPLAIHTDTDLSKSWQLELKRTEERAFEAPANLLMYVTDRGELRHRGVSHWPRNVKASGKRKIRIARLKYQGNWDPEPLAYERFRRLLAARANVNVEIVSPVEIGRLNDSGAKIATMTGTERFELTSEEESSLKRFLETGGTLIVDAGGGSRAFAESAEVMLVSMFGRTAVRRLASTAPLYNLPGMRIRKAHYRRKARLALGGMSQPNLRVVRVGERSAVLFSKEDITGGLVGYPSYACVGYQPETAFELMRNAVVYADRTSSGGRRAAGGAGR